MNFSVCEFGVRYLVHHISMSRSVSESPSWLSTCCAEALNVILSSSLFEEYWTVKSIEIYCDAVFLAEAVLMLSGTCEYKESFFL